MADNHVVVIGAGAGGLAAAVDLAARGVRVSLFERADRPGGKMRRVPVGEDESAPGVDAGPTVFTMRWVFEELFAAAGANLADRLSLTQAEVLARHAWPDGARFDLFADPERSEAAVEALSGPDEAARFAAFTRRARSIFDTLDHTFMRAERPNPVSLVWRVARAGRLARLMSISPFSSLWDDLGTFFHDPRLRQLFGRYSTYCGASPFLAPATLMLIAHVEQEGVWLPAGGMHGVARAIAGLAADLGAEIHYGRPVAEIMVKGGRAAGVRLADGQEIAADAVIFNGDAQALAQGLLGASAEPAVRRLPAGRRALSAVTWTGLAEARDFPLSHHTVFFCGDYRAEFDAVFRHRRLPEEPTVYVCAQDRGATLEPTDPAGPERLLMLVNAPASGDTHPFPDPEIDACRTRAFDLMARAGLSLSPESLRLTATTPATFHRLFPATGGSLYGQAIHGWRASFTRPPAASRLPGLFLAGGSVHPGAGVPMATLSGRLAAAAALKDLTSR
ncbi:1-hydroxycarotenoid 3,4-desaturase CrtD [Roseospirillum parvum]|uniref:1-hydroxycarotenoid 3,4-desaturase n=1 Tax=Roseospirillum parvum TaxID=83401 RepID=A0A1G8BU65_9PROT|nr:1-hydroxycarotenoid 3,4-desaturase CrtD [Roseospirillum parvum]SDH36240.1 1-hydroxycarotenoid 3,4-desaturase [Roseospirillum parvum]